MSPEILIAGIAALPPTLAAVLGYLGNRRAIRRSVGNSPAIPLTKVMERLEGKVDQLIEGQASLRERLARLEGTGGPSPKDPIEAERGNPSTLEARFEQ